jgi:tetratricopeptide (TPR) repeat protein
LSYQDRKSAIGLGNLALESWQALGDRLGIAIATSSLGCIYYQARFYDRSTELLNESLAMFEQLKNPEWRGTVCSWKGALLQDLGQYDAAESCLKQALEFGPIQNKAMTLNRLGRVYMSRKDWNEAEKYLKESYELAQEIPDYTYWLGSIARLITVAAEQKQYKRIGEFQTMLDEFAGICPYPDRNSEGIAYFGMARLALGMQGVKTATEFLKKAITDIVEYGSYAHTDVRARLNYLERDFSSLSDDVVQYMGRELRLNFKEKTSKNASYDVVTIRLHKWEKWKNQNEQLTQEMA